MQLKDELNKLLQDDSQPIKAIVICDPGLDDALMLLQILSSATYQIVGIIPVSGNAKTYYTVNNTLNLCELLGKTSIPIYPGSDYDPMTPDQDKKTSIYGQEGLCSITLPKAKAMQKQEHSCIDFACQALEKERHLIISTASTSEPAKILQQLSNSALKNIIAISLMGGVINPTQEANWPIKGTELHKSINQQVTEANLGFDPTASKNLFDICARHGVPILLAPLDLTHSILASTSDLTIIKEIANPAAELAYQIIAGVPKHYQNRYSEGPDGKVRQPLHDMISSSCLMHPELYTGCWVTIDVTDKLTSAQATITNTNGGNVFLLDMHYVYRTKFFLELANDLKHYHYLCTNAKQDVVMPSNATALQQVGIYSVKPPAASIQPGITYPLSQQFKS